MDNHMFSHSPSFRWPAPSWMASPFWSVPRLCACVYPRDIFHVCVCVSICCLGPFVPSVVGIAPSVKVELLPLARPGVKTHFQCYSITCSSCSSSSAPNGPRLRTDFISLSVNWNYFCVCVCVCVRVHIRKKEKYDERNGGTLSNKFVCHGHGLRLSSPRW